MIKKFCFRFFCECFFIIINKSNNYKYKIYLLNILLRFQSLIPLSLKEKIYTDKHLFSNLNYQHVAPLIKKGPLVSIIVTYYDNHNLINYSIYSLVNQTYKNIQIIIVFDGCKPSNIKCIKQKFKKYKCIEFITLKKNIGNALAKNKAIPYIRGKYVTVHDSDDIAHPQKIELHTEEILRDPSFLGSVSYWLRLNKKFEIQNIKKKFLNTRINPSSLLFHKKILNKYKYENLKKGNDSLFLKKITEKRIGSVKIINKHLTIGSFRKLSISNKFN